ncbi:SART-1 protein [Rickenella mellea]|uniref:SART-1 protein n=1 Tax=Rickenella mellea TaxID=50990 RepID=A0A4Y7PPZ6_9AGAM|nr:SART-1 protein [Rickenella mellea]
MESSISLEETNKIRISLGLKPLVDDKKPTDDKEQEAEQNYTKAREEERKAQEKRVKNKRELNASLKGATLGDIDPDVDNTLKWLKKSKKREKELAKKRQEEQEDMDKQFQGEDYTEKDLAGLKVSHDLDGLAEGEDQILTLKDSRILDNEEDELQNVELAEHEKTKKNNELKIKKRDYTGYDDEEFVDGQAGVRRSILAKYDEDLDGPRETGFRLGDSGPKSSKVTREMEENAAAVVNKSLLSIDYAKNMEITDYLQEGDVGFKKPKKKKKRPQQRVAESSDITPANEDDKMIVDEKPGPTRVKDLDANFVDDDELQAALARARREKTKLRKVLLPTTEEIAQRVVEERTLQNGANGDTAIKVDDDDEEEQSGITFDDTSEFVRAISYNPVVVKAEPLESKPALSDRNAKANSQPPVDHPMNGTDEAMEELEAGELLVKEEEDEEAILNALEAAMHAAEAAENGTKKEEDNGDMGVGTSSEQSYGTGMAATLNILRQQGVLAAPTSDAKERERVQRQRDLWLAEYRTRQALRELERLKARGEKKDQAQREYENRVREQQEAREGLEVFKDYKPDVNIVYHDEFGRELTPKEAWKALSHRFHGKGSGKAKTEKRLKKIAEEKKKEAMASGDTPLSMNRAFQMRQEKAGQAHFVLSVGSRGAVPQASEFLDPPTLSKGKTEKTKSKKKEAAKDKRSEVVDMTGFTALPPATPLSTSASPGPSGGPSRMRTESPVPAAMMRPSFSRVSEPSSGVGTPVSGPGERSKVSIGFGLKRKAGEEANGSPPSKKR